jgi:hypothetical protein
MVAAALHGTPLLVTNLALMAGVVAMMVAMDCGGWIYYAFVALTVLVVGMANRREYELIQKIHVLEEYQELYIDLTCDLGWWQTDASAEHYFYVSQDLAALLHTPAGAAVTRMQITAFLMRYLHGNQLIDTDLNVHLTDDAMYTLLPEATDDMPLAHVVLEIQKRHLL